MTSEKGDRPISDVPALAIHLQTMGYIFMRYLLKNDIKIYIRNIFCCKGVLSCSKDYFFCCNFAATLFFAALYECLFWACVDWLRFHVRKERSHFQRSDEMIHENNLWSKSSIAYQIQLRFKNIFISNMTFIVSA